MVERLESRLRPALERCEPRESVGDKDGRRVAEPDGRGAFRGGASGPKQIALHEREHSGRSRVVRRIP